MSNPADLPNNPSPPDRDSELSPRRADRRRLLQSGLAAAPVLLTLVSQPVLGQCTTGSALGSGIHSGPMQRVAVCSGLTPAFWKQPQHFSSWPSPYIPETVKGVGDRQATKFHPCFAGSQCAGKTLLEVLDPSTADSAGLARYIVAALLNAQAGRTPVLTVGGVKTIWSECTAKGCYEPTAGVRWYPREIVAYLKTTMPL
ncbi:MAG: hypothetical protein WKH97_04795 [Casimicrobiaceae bacterium]